ncbi:MAG: hypothetical protein KC646_00830 [Candidatus Cloacimonetes bacterium]|nr:hypothetical protein [Candidatus Cloacimonadota bacterium]
MKKLIQITLIIIFAYLCIYPQWFMTNLLNLDSISSTPLHKKFNPSTQQYAFLIESNKIPKGLTGVKAKDCSVCHKEIYDEWSQTTHAHALSDLQFQAEISKKDNPKWLCLNCHIPLKSQRKNITVALKNNDILKPISKPNPHFDKALQQEAITCAVCHLVKDKNNQAAILGPKGSKLSPHPVVKDQKRLQNVCIRCHQPSGDQLTPNLLCWFHPLDELKSNQSKDSCVDCHMPKNSKKISIASLKTTSSSAHHWLGSAIPKTYKGYDTILKRGFTPSITASSNITTNKITVNIQNKDSGHHLPSGDPERYFALILTTQDNKNKTSTHVARIGQTWQWDPAKKIGDNRLKPHEAREFELPLKGSIISYSYEIWNTRLNGQNAGYMTLAKGLDEQLASNINQDIKQLHKLYPLATLMYKENYTKNNGVIKLNSQQLLDLSKDQKNIAFRDRIYANLENFPSMPRVTASDK